MTAAANLQSNLRDGDPLEIAKERLFAPVKNRSVAEAAEAIQSENLAIAEALLERHLKKRPRDAEALNLMAEIARRARRFEDAERMLAQCTGIDPDNPGYRYNHAIALRRLHKDEEALRALDVLVEREPDNPLFLDQRATVLSRLGRHTEALEIRKGLIATCPESAEIWLRYAHAARDVGFQDRCIEALRKALVLNPKLPGAYATFADLKVYRFSQPEIERMEALIAGGGLSHDDRTALHHALGKAYCDVKRYDRSFEHYAKGNAIRRLKVDFDANRVAAYRKDCERFFDEEFFRAHAGWGCDSRAPIFIVGMPRSGSTLLEQILSSHSVIEGIGEGTDLDETLLRPLATATQDVRLQEFAKGNIVEKSGLVDAYMRLGDLTPARFRELGEQYLHRTARSRTTGRPHFTDKTLRNFFYIGLIQLMLPNAKIVDTRRHPLDCGWSCFRSQFPGMNFALRLADIGQDYANYVRLMDHFDRVLPGRVYRVIYERLIADPRAELMRLFEYLEIPFEESCLRFYENPRAVMTQSSEQVRQPLYKSGMAQWVPYEPWLGPLKTALGAVLECYPDPPPPDGMSAASAGAAG